MSIGADYWRLYGWQDEDSFVQDMAGFMPSLAVGSWGLTQQDMARQAYENPWSMPGTVASGVTLAGKVLGLDPVQQQVAADDSVRYVTRNPEGKGMAQLIIPGVYQVAIQAVSGGQQVVNVIGVRNSGGSALGAAQAVLKAWKVTAGPLARHPSQYQMTGVHAMSLASENGDIADVADSTSGGITATSLATNGSCALVKWNGGTRSGTSRGRMYHGPLTEDQVQTDGRRIATGEQTALTTAYANFMASLNADGYPLVVISRKAQTATTVTSHLVETIIASQRRRIRG